MEIKVTCLFASLNAKLRVIMLQVKDVISIGSLTST